MRPASKLLSSFVEIARQADACPRISGGVQAHSFKVPFPSLPLSTRLCSSHSPAPQVHSSINDASTASTHAPQHAINRNFSSAAEVSSSEQPSDLSLPLSIRYPTVIGTEQPSSTVTPLSMDSYKLPYAVMRSAIYENDIHMEHVGELANFIKIRRAQTWYSNNIESYRTLAVLLGNITRGKMVRYLERAKRARLADRRWAFMSLLEARLDMTLLRMGLTHNIRMAQAWTRHNKLTVNGEKINRVAHEVRPGDVIAVAPARRQEVVNRLTEDLEHFFWEVHGTPPRRPVYYQRSYQVDPDAPVERHQLQLGNLIRKVTQQIHNKVGIEQAMEAALQPNSTFNVERRALNHKKHPWRMKIQEVDRKGRGSSPAAVDEQLRRSFWVMLQKRRGVGQQAHA